MERQAHHLSQAVWAHYQRAGRHDLPWRQPQQDGSFDAYGILVSELMLQQTQVARVIPKFYAFLQEFPTVQALAAAPLDTVLRLWSGLGYNRRARFLWEAARIIVRDFGGRLPDSMAELTRLPGVGPNTAGAILAYAYNQPAVFVETNIRTVYIHHFFADRQQVDDRLIADAVVQALPKNVREWYWALMDYGTLLKQTEGNLSRRSRHYQKQSTFVGSRRQVRGQVLRALNEGARSARQLMALVADERLPGVLVDLTAEGLIAEHGDRFKLSTQ